MANYNLFDAASLAMIPVGSKEGKVYSIKPEPVYGSEEITNGDFATDSDWTKETGWTISNGVASYNGSGSNNGIYQNKGFTTGKKYKLSFSVKNYVSGTLVGALSSGSLIGNTPNITKNGNYSFDLTATGVLCIFRSTSNFIGSIDNVSVKEVLVSGDFTFSRGSNLAATRVSADGLIEKGRENLLKQSNNFNTTWVKTSATVTSDVIAGPLGELADSVFANAGSAQHRVLQTPVSTGTGTFSMYIKQKELSRIVIHLLGVNKAIGFDCSNNTTFTAVGVAADAEYYAITDAGNGWSKIEVFAGGTTTRVDIYIANPVAGGNNAVWTGDGTSEIYISSAQFELGTISTPYIKTTTTTGTAGILEQTPRFDYSNGASCPSLLLEPSRTNRFAHSEYSGGFSSGSASSATDNQAISPEGLQNAIKIEKTTNGYAYFRTTLAAATGCLSVFAKKGNYRYIGLRNNQTDGTHSAFDFDTETFTNVASGQTCTFENYGNGWYRLTAYQPNNEGSAYQGIAIVKANGSELADSSVPNGSHFFIYGLQQEGNASYKTSYIPTYGTSQTRAPEVCGDAGDANTFNSTEGVLYAEIAALDNTQSASQYITISDGTYNNRLSILYSNGATNSIRAFLRVGGASQVDFSASIGNQKSFNKIAFKYKQNDFSLWVNGIEVATDTSGSTVSSDTLDELSFSEIGTSAGLFNGKVKQVLTFNTALLDTELAALTLRYENYQEWVTGEGLTWESPSCTNNNITELKNL